MSLAALAEAPASGSAVAVAGGMFRNSSSLRMDLDRIDLDPAVMGGKPRIRGTRVTVGVVVGLLGAGRTVDEVLDAYPYIERSDVEAALTYAAWRAEEREVPLRAA